MTWSLGQNKFRSTFEHHRLMWALQAQFQTRPEFKVSKPSVKKNEKLRSPQQWDVSRSQQPCGGLPCEDMLISAHFFAKPTWWPRLTRPCFSFSWSPQSIWPEFFLQDIHGWKWKSNNDNWTHCIVLNKVTFLADFPASLTGVCPWKHWHWQILITRSSWVGQSTKSQCNPTLWLIDTRCRRLEQDETASPDSSPSHLGQPGPAKPWWQGHPQVLSAGDVQQWDIQSLSHSYSTLLLQYVKHQGDKESETDGGRFTMTGEDPEAGSKRS